MSAWSSTVSTPVGAAGSSAAYWISELLGLAPKVFVAAVVGGFILVAISAFLAERRR